MDGTVSLESCTCSNALVSIKFGGQLYAALSLKVVVCTYSVYIHVHVPAVIICSLCVPPNKVFTIEGSCTINYVVCSSSCCVYRCVSLLLLGIQE